MTIIKETFADFNNADQFGRVRLNSNRTKADLVKLGITLETGMTLLLNDGEGLKALGSVIFT